MQRYCFSFLDVLSITFLLRITSSAPPQNINPQPRMVRSRLGKQPSHHHQKWQSTHTTFEFQNEETRYSSSNNNTNTNTNIPSLGSLATLRAQPRPHAVATNVVVAGRGLCALFLLFCFAAAAAASPTQTCGFFNFLSSLIPASFVASR